MEHKKNYVSLATKIKELCGQDSVYYLPNPGNWGDGLIRYGTLKFFRDINLEYKELTFKKKDWFFPCINGGTIIYGGGGAWCKYWRHSELYARRISKRFKLIVLPSTYEHSFSIPNTTFFRRDQYESKQNMPHSFFSHDMAFYIGNEYLTEAPGRGEGYFFRTDIESAINGGVPEENNDISSNGNEFSNVSNFFQEINKFSTVYTDRLHVAIAALLLKKETHLYAGKYFKNKAVFMSSIKSYFNNAYFHENNYLKF